MIFVEKNKEINDAEFCVFFEALYIVYETIYLRNKQVTIFLIYKKYSKLLRFCSCLKKTDIYRALFIKRLINYNLIVKYLSLNGFLAIQI